MADINIPFLLLQLLSMSVLVVWIVLAFRALRALSRANMPELARLGWSLIILSIPVVGALTFLTTRPRLSKTTL